MSYLISKDYKTDSIRFEKFVSDLADKAQGLLMRSPLAGAVYLVYREAGPADVDVLFEDVPGGYSVAASFRGDLTRDQMRSKIWELIRRVPVYRENEEEGN